MLKKTILLVIMTVQTVILSADEGMWLLPRLKQYNQDRMRELGLRVSADYLADTLSQAIILFNGNGTASFISGNGLILTNYHCARTGIQQASSDEHNYLKDGFWAQSRVQEIPLKNISISINKMIKDVSAEVNRQIKGVAAQELYRIQNRIADKYRRQYPGMQARIRSYSNNTIHILYVTQTFNDIRLVGAPPIDIAKFGGETDNWTWPRHGCDFALLRAYVSKDGKGVAYSKDNVPYHPATWLKVSADGIQEGDYAMSMGYPGFTNRKATSMQIWEQRNVHNPPLVRIRTARQEILQKFMRADEGINIKYAEKFAASANYCKNYNGMNEWTDRLDLCGKKAGKEQAIIAACGNEAKKQELIGMFADIESGIRAAAPYNKATTYYIEAFGEACDMIKFVSVFGNALKNKGSKEHILANARLYYKDYVEEGDKEVTKAVLGILISELDDEMLTPTMLKLKAKGTGDAVAQYVDNLYSRSAFANLERVTMAVNDAAFNVESDPVYVLTKEIETIRQTISRKANGKREVSQRAMLKYHRMMSGNIDGEWYPDADKSIRLSYGIVCGMNAHLTGMSTGTDSIIIKPWHTTMAGVMEKVRTRKADYTMPDKYVRMWNGKSLGCYSAAGDVPVGFITNGDVTGGNSGSPMLNANGEVVGLVFDCNWESMLRDFDFNTDLHRVICLDIRYLMFIVGEYAGMKNIANEIKGN